MGVSENLGTHSLQWPVRLRNPHNCLLVGRVPFAQLVVWIEICVHGINLVSGRALSSDKLFTSLGNHMPLPELKEEAER